MRKKLYLLPVVIILIAVLCGFKGGNGFTIETDDDFAVATEEDDVKDVAKRLSISESEVKKYFSDNSLVFIAVSPDGKTQIRISCFSDEFSNDVYDTENLSDEQVSKMMSLYSTSAGIVKVVESGGRKYAKTVQLLNDSGGEYTVTHYVTVASRKTYVISCYNPGVGTSSEVKEIFSTFSANDLSTEIKNYDTQKKWVMPAVIAAFTIVLVCVVGLCIKLYEK